MKLRQSLLRFSLAILLVSATTSLAPAMTGSTAALTAISQFSVNNVMFNGQGVLGTVPAGQSANVDLTLADDCFITGAHLRVKNANFTDTISLQVIYVDGTTVLRQFVTNWHMAEDQQDQGVFEVTYPAKVLAGWTLRAVYTSTGENPVTVSVDYVLHKPTY